VEPLPPILRHEPLQASNLYHAFTNYDMYLYKIIRQSPPYNSACFPSHRMPLLKANKLNVPAASSYNSCDPSIVSKKKGIHTPGASLSVSFLEAPRTLGARSDHEPRTDIPAINNGRQWLGIKQGKTKSRDAQPIGQTYTQETTLIENR
jgi:hypothetical protein